MSKRKFQMNLFDFLLSIARVVDLMNPQVGRHHLQVAYLAYRIGEELGMPESNLRELLTAGVLHDIGAFSLKERLDLLAFEDTHPGVHAEAGYLILRRLDFFVNIADFIRFHHVPWRCGKGDFEGDRAVPYESHILHLADRIAVSIEADQPVLSQAGDIARDISSQRDSLFMPEQVDAFLAISETDYIWLDATSLFLESILKRMFSQQSRDMTIDQMLDFARLICHLIDFKSEFTATHSSGVAAAGLCLAGLSGFSRYEQRLLEMAAYLHDLGKLAVPLEILEKKGRLSDEEWYVMRSHVYYTHETLAPFTILGDVGVWGGLHQERLDGSGYPFGYREEDIPLGAKILAVADVFTALTESRPYRRGLNKHETLDVMMQMADQGELDRRLVRMAADSFDPIDTARERAQQRALQEYGTFQTGLVRA